MDQPHRNRYRRSNRRVDSDFTSWIAPEHYRGAIGMERNRNPNRGPLGHLVIDVRANLLRLHCIGDI